jgi:hypothetical protein
MEPNTTTIVVTSKQSYLRTDENKIINEKCIRWVQKMGDCLAVCNKAVGCHISETHRICKLNNPDSYNKLNQYF